MRRRTDLKRFEPPAALRAAILLSVVLDLPVLGATVRRLTPEPRTEEIEIEGVPVEVVRPRGRGPWPAWVFVNGAHPLRRREPIVHLLAQGLARAGYVAVVPDLPGLGTGEITRGTLDAVVAVVEAAANRPDVRDGRVAICGASAGASLALIAAEQTGLRDRVTVVAAVTPWARLDKIVGLATTGHYEEGGVLVAYPVSALLRRVVARSLVAALAPCEGREDLLAAMRCVESDDVDACEELRRIDSSRLGLHAHAVVSLLVNDDPARFADLYAALPAEVTALVNTLSPLTAASSLTSKVELVRPPVDPYFPLEEAVTLAGSLPQARLTVTRVLDHTRPSLTLDHLRSLYRFNGFVVRGLAAAAGSS